jgi:hypothetical protein
MGAPADAYRWNRSSRAVALLVVLGGLLFVGGGLYSLLATDGTGVTADDDAAAAGASAHALSACTIIADPGYYVLTTDLESETDGCLEIVASDVVLDGDGHTVRGASQLVQGSRAVAVGPVENEPRLENVTVRDLSVVNWVSGVVYDDVVDGAIVDVTTFQTVDGVTVRDSRSVTVTGARVRNGCVGMSVVRSAHVDVRDTTMRWFTTVGLSVVDSHAVTVSNVAVSDVDVGVALYRTEDVAFDNVTVTDAEGNEVVVESTDERRACSRGSD